jgi:hypothetical protein
MLNNNLIKVQLQIYWEQGMEGVEWAAHDNTKKGWEGFISLNDGDYLEIPNLWKGVIIHDTEIYKTFPNIIKTRVKNGEYRDILNSYGWATKSLSDNRCKSYVYSNYEKQVIEGYTCLWLQKGVDPKLWVKWFEDELEAYYCPQQLCL